MKRRLKYKNNKFNRDNATFGLHYLPSRKGMRTLMSDWFHIKRPCLEFYTPFVGSKYKYVAVGDGTKDPSPNELVKYLNETSGYQAHYSGKFVSAYLDQEYEQEPEDLPGGAYVYRTDDGSTPERLVPMSLRKDKFVSLTDGIEKKVKSDIEKFLSSKKLYKDKGIIYKLGVLLYGQPGVGKTFLLREIIKSLPKKTVTIFIEGDFPSDEFILKLKELNKLKVFVFEELAAELSDWYIGRLLTFLDGELSVDNSICLATTNYPEKLPANIVDRPRRFDKLYCFEPPKDNERSQLIKEFLGREATEVEIKSSKGLSIASLQEACLSSILDEITLLEALKVLKDRSELCKKAFARPKEVTLGFGVRDDY